MTNTLQEMKKIADEKLEAEKDKLSPSYKLQARIDEARELVKDDFNGFDVSFSFGILTQLCALKSGKYDDVDDAMKLQFERSILKTVTSGNQIEMMLVTQMIAVHNAIIGSGRLFGNSKQLDEIESYGNTFNKLTRTFAAQTEALQRLRSGPVPTLQQNFSVSNGGQVVGVLNQSALDKDKPDTAQSPLLVTDQSRTAMPILRSDDDQAVPIVPLIEPDQEPAPKATGRKQRK
jgi:hypothetical protein